MRRLLAILLAAGALIGAGCGESDDSATPAATSTPAPEQEDRGSYGY